MTPRNLILALHERGISSHFLAVLDTDRVVVTWTEGDLALSVVAVELFIGTICRRPKPSELHGYIDAMVMN